MSINRRELLKYIAGGIAIGSVMPELSQASPAPTSNPEADNSPIHLDRNENAYGPSESALAAIREGAMKVNRYPEDSSPLKEAIASQHGIQTDQVLIGCGSSEIIRTAIDAFLGPGKKLLVSTPTFELPARLARERKATVLEIPLKKDHSHDLNGMLSKADSRTGLIYICNPNNPTSTLTERQDIDSFLKKLPSGIPVLIDEAYHEYAGGSGAYASFLERPAESKNVLVTRSFSKAFGLAGLRVGYAAGAKDLLQKMGAKKLQFGVNTMGIAAATAAYNDHRHIENCVQNNENDRQEFLNQVNARMLRAFDSHTNFICLNVMRPGNEIVEHFKKNNIVLPPPFPLLPNYVRVSLGSPGEMKGFWRIWDQMRSHPMAM